MTSHIMKPDESILEMFRDPDGHFYFMEIDTEKIVYQSEMVADRKLLIHKEGKDSPALATVDLTKAKEGIVVVEFTEPAETVELRHIHHRLPFTHANTYFTYEGTQYHWKAHAALLENDRKVCVAVFHTMNLGGVRHKHGSLVLDRDGLKMRDLAAVTRLADMARHDEVRLEKSEKS